MSDNRKLYSAWEELWSEAGEKGGLTVLGKVMFRAKKKALDGILPALDVTSVLEVGCGLGHILQVYHDAGYDSLGVDISPSAVKVCREKGLHAECVDIAEETRQFDLVSSDGMLEHFLHFEPMANDMMRASRKYLLLFQPNHESLLGWFLPFLANKVRGDDIIFEYNYRIRDFNDVMRANGFRLEQSVPVFFDVFRMLLYAQEG